MGKDSRICKKLEKSLCALDKAKNLYWMPRLLRIEISQAFMLITVQKHCIKNSHDSGKEISTWAQERPQKQVSVNTVHHAINKYRETFCNAQRNHIRNHLLWPKIQNSSSVVEVTNSSLVLGIKLDL